MKHGLLVLAAVLALAVAAPVSAQYMYIDVNGDGLNTTADVLGPTVTSVDIYLGTNKSLTDPNDINSPVIDITCPFGPDPLSINSYTIILTAPSGGVVYGAWTDNMTFTIDVGNAQAGNDKVIGWASASPQGPGLYKLGSLGVTITGNPVLTFAASTSISGTAITSFGSLCTGAPDYDNTQVYQREWYSIGPTRSPIPVTETTWGTIKSLYH